MATKQTIERLDHIPDGHPVTTAQFNALIDAINALAGVVIAQAELEVARTANPQDGRIAHRKDSRQAKPR